MDRHARRRHGPRPQEGHEGHQYLAAHIQPKLEHYWHMQHAARGLPSAYPDLSYDIAVVAATS